MHIGIDLGGTKTESIIIDKNGKENFRITNSIDFTSKDFTDKIKKLEQL